WLQNKWDETQHTTTHHNTTTHLFTQRVAVSNTKRQCPSSSVRNPPCKKPAYNVNILSLSKKTLTSPSAGVLLMLTKTHKKNSGSLVSQCTDCSTRCRPRCAFDLRSVGGVCLPMSQASENRTRALNETCYYHTLGASRTRKYFFSSADKRYGFQARKLLQVLLFT
ncbi:unnamed protein product, partial [Ectocarpus sp. 12 AP-2014]